jgi:N-acetylated-alpha-linked acidic dipeptidase
MRVTKAVAPVLCGLYFISVGRAQTYRGYLARDVPAQQRLEDQARSLPDSSRLRSYMEFLAGQPHAAGSPRSKAVAEYIQKQLTEWGLSAEIEQFQALMPYPTMRLVEVLGPKPFIAKLKEPPLAVDPGTAEANQMPTYNAYGATGDVIGDVVYANFGVPDDYDWLAKQGIDVRGKIVLTRYGKSWRGIKPKVAAEHGAIGCLIYSDPHEDGYFDADVFPKGPMRPPDGVQRGSVLDITLYPGDPLSPGWSSEAGSRRLPLQDAKTLMKIPVMPLSYADAQPILEQLAGPVVPVEWRGSLPLTYHAGPGNARVHLKTDYDWTSKPLFDVIATIPGESSPDEWILAGNHHDAWVNGADDPVSSLAALLETARVLGLMQKAGWKPRRTVKLAFWDGEEFGLLGSTEWVEKHQDELRQKAAVYLNSDNTGRGWLHLGGSHSLETFATEIADSIPQPGTGASLAEYAVHHPLVPPSEQSEEPAETSRRFGLGALGAGSDYQGFLDFLGVASLNEYFAGQTKSGIYHSSYDSVYWYTHFSDTTFDDGRALAEYITSAIARLANALILPFEFHHFVSTLSLYLDQVQRQSERNGQKMDFVPLRKQLELLDAKAQNYDALLEAASLKDATDPAQVRKLNQSLIRTERVLTRPEGLPHREWYKHQIYAPGFYTGYAVKTLPGIREAVEQRDWKLAQHEARVLEQCLNSVVGEGVQTLSGF